MSAAVVVPEPEPVPVQSLRSPSPSSSSSVIPAFPEQSDVPSQCHLSLPSDLSFLTTTTSLSLSPAARFCPALAAALYAAYSSSALSVPAAARPTELPELPEDPEYCAGEAERAMRARGVELPRVNATCDAAYCYCGVRLRRMTCAGEEGFVADGDGTRWVPRAGARRRLERDCRRTGPAVCNTCLRVLNQLNGNESTSASKDSRECQLMGLTWLLSQNVTLYLPAATSVLRTFMATPDGSTGPTSCSLPRHEMLPFAVGSSEITGDSDSAAAAAAAMVDKLTPVNVALVVAKLIIIFFVL